ncbi:MAG: acyl-CoA dehydratase activase [Syntrophaceae bacterium]
MITAGFDIGTRAFKICLVEDTRLLSCVCRLADRNLEQSIRDCYKQLLAGQSLSRRQVNKAIATGYGANLVTYAAYELSEPACLARAAHQFDPGLSTLIDIGALFIRIVKIDENGFLEDSDVNEPCAAGSGKFLELVAEALAVSFEDISTIARRSLRPYAITSTCAVFAESEIISQINAGVASQDILAGALDALVSKVQALLGKAGDIGKKLALTGGVAKIPALREKLATALDKDLIAPPLDPQLIPAYGAALLAQGRSRRRP